MGALSHVEEVFCVRADRPKLLVTNYSTSRPEYPLCSHGYLYICTVLPESMSGIRALGTRKGPGWGFQGFPARLRLMLGISFC